MAGMDKWCHFCGQYVGPEMQDWKLDFIQICKEHRPLFRGANAEVILTRETDNPVVLEKTARGKFRWSEGWELEFIVYDEELKGKVDGVYYNECYDVKKTIRKLKRLTRRYDLPVTKIDMKKEENNV